MKTSAQLRVVGKLHNKYITIVIFEFQIPHQATEAIALGYWGIDYVTAVAPPSRRWVNAEDFWGIDGVAAVAEPAPPRPLPMMTQNCWAIDGAMAVAAPISPPISPPKKNKIIKSVGKIT